MRLVEGVHKVMKCLSHLGHACRCSVDFPYDEKRFGVRKEVSVVSNMDHGEDEECQRYKTERYLQSHLSGPGHYTIQLQLGYKGTTPRDFLALALSVSHA